jgi:hypothetical protein
MTFRPWLSLMSAVLCLVVLSPRATAQPAAAASPSDDVPFMPARGDDGPLALSISGLKRGSALVGSGPRVFGMCWKGGVGPFEVTLRDADADVLVHVAAIAGQDLVVAARPVLFSPGTYTVVVADSAGHRALGQLKAVEQAKLPTLPADLTSDPKALGRIDRTYRYEAYLRVLPATLGSQDPGAVRLAAQLCHRSQ